MGYGNSTEGRHGANHAKNCYGKLPVRALTVVKKRSPGKHKELFENGIGHSAGRG